ncbi:Hsp20/alpha crystallin family protein [Dethiobacter alkaliphilus]|uniref:Heat shock protein Hsp20 n=1 Tax=Dethiobacter alkaliphilus AHT 1 TaxID=555088 RepID=C0GJK2_DETAL|nr:Hsp20/alpha crystallin family protein [Dethiobacter alkaliphilus]EEG76549.1 heat shock protein Hsp20 [Dethiobacter alkaliphilus AHT 1]
MLSLTSWNPYGEFARMAEEQRHMRFPDSPFLDMKGQPYDRMPGPTVDIHETEKEVLVSAEIPGANPDELDITVDDMQITISGEIKRRADRERDGYRMVERRYGRFSRTVPLPVEVKPDEAWADYHHGVLEVRINKVENGRIRSRKLKVNTQQH